MWTVLDVFKRSLRMIGQLGPGRAPNTSEKADALVVLNGMLDQSNTSPLLRYTTRIDAYDLVADQFVYTLGPGGDWDGDRPVRIVRANRILVGSPDVRTPIAVLDDEQWSGIHVQQITGSSVPTAIYPDGSWPLINVSVWPGASSEYQIELYTWQKIDQFLAETDIVDCPDGYFDWMSYNLAERLALEWGKELRPEVANQARLARAAIKAPNTRAPRMQNDAPGSNGGSFNYRTGS